MISSWYEQREYNYEAINALKMSKVANNKYLANEIEEAILNLYATFPDLSNFTIIKNNSEIFDCNRFQISFGKSGAIEHLYDKLTQTNWASPSNRIAFFSYQTYSSSDANRFLSEYLDCSQCSWATQGSNSINQINQIKINQYLFHPFAILSFLLYLKFQILENQIWNWQTQMHLSRKPL